LKDQPEKWVYKFSEDEIRELGEAADKVMDQGLKLVEVTKVSTEIARGMNTV
jgi:hypothetical protein